MERASRRTFLRIGGGAILGTVAGGALLSWSDGYGTPVLRPPGAGPEPRFLARCVRCSQCIQACPTHVLRIAPANHGWGAGTPWVDARAQPCDLCFGRDQMECIASCPTGALQPVATRAAVRMGTAVVDTETCLPYVGVSCRACWHACPFPDAAISVDDTGHPDVHADACTGCGLCVHACLTEPASIRIEPLGAKQSARAR